ncbi:MAG: hypothetical protein DMF94_30360 [Acidobacteria bacterium]|nr:MAG: hypothetical protein DMF94_30360 [Acidobacteriota bacterium]
MPRPGSSHEFTLRRLPVISLLREDNTRKGFFEPQQFRKVLAELPDSLRPLFETAYETGWRVRSELLNRQWKHVDFDGGWLRLEPGETKNRQGRMFPLTPSLRAVLERRKKVTEQLGLLRCMARRVRPGWLA